MKQKQFRKLLLFLPVMIYPFLCLLFFVAHGVKAEGTKSAASLDGINKEVPQAIIETTPKTKMSLYDLARNDSEKISLAARLDRHALNLDLSGGVDKHPGAVPVEDTMPRLFTTQPVTMHSGKPDAATRAQEQLAALQKQVELASSEAARPKEAPEPPAENSEIARLEKMMQAASGGASEPDSELLQLDGMLDKILQIQHPELLSRNCDTTFHADRRSLAQGAGKPGTGDFDSPPALDSFRRATATMNRFYDLDKSEVIATGNAFSAMTATSVAVVDGAQLPLILTEDMTVADKVIPKGTTLYGTCKMGNQRLFVTVSAVMSGKTRLAVNLEAYGTDGQRGLNAPEATTGGAVKDGTASVISSMDPGSLDQSLGAQAASAGIQTAKTFLSKKIRTVKVNVRAQSSLLLIDESQKN